MVLASNPMAGNWLAKVSTSFFKAVISGHSCSSSAALKSFSFGPTLDLMSAVILTALSTKSATCTKSCSMNPLVVRAGVPILMPPGTRALVSPGTVFLLAAMWASSMTRSTRDPSTPWGFKFTRTRWLSVPPDTRAYPSSWNLAAKAAQLLMTCSWYFLNSGCAACFSAKARAPMAWLWGPPWRPGKTAELIFLSRLTPWTSWPRL
mmetsp:Transcript_4710/g.11943  ORF Transcript_4710/g.11943 Transcript_4710/m.11943 type:complete len:206 (+) Transcript_4710:461-1078(+)